jgi:hypothetical protein
MPADFRGIILPHPPDNLEPNLERAIGQLVKQGISRRSAEWNAQFIVRYVIHNRLVVVAAPPEQERPTDSSA